MEPLFLLLFFLILSTIKKMQKLRSSIIPHPVRMSAKALPIVSLRFLSSLLKGLVVFWNKIDSFYNKMTLFSGPV
jgi:hypothetical protein